MSNKDLIRELFEVGAHYGFARSRRHPSVTSVLLNAGTKTGDIIDLEKTADAINTSVDLVSKIAASGRQILFVAGKNEARIAVKKAADSISMPYCNGRWIGGTLTNFKEIRKRVDRLEKLKADKENGSLDKYTKKERLLISREMDKLNIMFGGLAEMKKLPALVFLVDPEREKATVQEAKQLNIPVIAIAGSDCDLNSVTNPIPANDASKAVVELISSKIVEAYKAGQSDAKNKKEEK